MGKFDTDLQALRNLEKEKIKNRTFTFRDPYDKFQEHRVHYPLKHKRLQQLLNLGLNVADFIYFAPKKLDERKVKEFFKKYKKLSIRHFHEDEQRFFKCPVLYNIDNVEKAVEFARENNKEFYTLINQSISLKDSLFCGTIFWPLDCWRDRTFIMEYFRGPGTPRDIEKKSMSEIACWTGPMFFMIDTKEMSGVEYKEYEQLKFIIEETRNSTGLRSIIYEFSYYPYPVGKLQKNQIYWEWRFGDFYRYGVGGNPMQSKSDKKDYLNSYFVPNPEGDPMFQDPENYFLHWLQKQKNKNN